MLAGLLAACNGKENRPVIEPEPTGFGEAETAGVRIAAFLHGAPATAGLPDTGGLREAGLLPIRLVVENRGEGPVKIVPRQTFFVDGEKRAWPLLTSEQAYQRMKPGASGGEIPNKIPAPKNLEALTDFAVEVETAAGDSPETVGYGGLAEAFARNLPYKAAVNPAIAAGDRGFALLLFPGREEARGAWGLRLCLEQNGQAKFLTLLLHPLSSPGPSESNHEPRLDSQ